MRWLVLCLLCLPGLAIAGPNTVAVLYFDNHGPERFDPLSVGLSQMLITDLTGAEGLKVVERLRLQEVMNELELGHSGVVDPETAAELGKLLGSQWLLLGTYFELMGQLRIDARVIEVETGRILHAYGVTGKAEEFMLIEQAIAEDFRAALLRLVHGDPAREGKAPLQRTAPLAPGEPVIHEPDEQALVAAVAFSEGLIFLDQKEVDRARESFEKAIGANPQLTAARDQLAKLDL